jgi:PAS domain S-box-containing protein
MFIRPAIAFMNRLTYPRKFLLISLLFLAPLSLAMYFLLHELGDRIEFTRKETLGTRYLRPLNRLFRHSGDLQRRARVFARGDRGVRLEVLERISGIDEDLLAVDGVDRDLGTDLNTSIKFAHLKESWRALKGELPDPAAKDPDRLPADFVAEIREFYSHVGDSSNLILDPDLDTYYLTDAILLKLHEGQALLMRAGLDGEAIAARKTASPEERAQFIVLLGLIRSNLDATRKGAEASFRNNPSGTARPRLEKAYGDFDEGARACVDALSRDLVAAGGITAAPEAVAAATARPLELSALLWARAAAELDELLQARIAKFEGRRRIAWITTLLVLSVVSFLWFAFYAAVMGTVSSLEQASRRMLGADPSREIVLETQDELGRATRSFNAIARRLREEWEQATEDNARARAAEARLQQSEERTRLIIHSALDAVIAIDPEGRVAEWNPQAAAIFGWSRDQTIGKRLSEVIIPEKHREVYEKGLQRYAAEGEGPLLNRRIELSALRSDGTEFPVEISITPLSHGPGAGFSAFVRDITDRKRSEEEIHKARDVAEAANRLKSEFLANMSHELRTPLNAIIGFSELMYNGKVPQEDHHEYLGDVLNSSRHLLQLINGVLDLAKVESGKMEFHPEPLHLPDIVGEVKDILQSLAAKKRIQLDVDVAPEVRDVLLDGARLKQVLYNYLSNAVKFSPEGSRIAIRILPEGTDELRIEVEDHGIGISAEDIPRLFVEFQQLDASTAKKHQGTGLGLALTKRIVEAQGGRVGVVSSVARGSVFSAILPRKESAAPAGKGAAHGR